MTPSTSIFGHQKQYRISHAGYSWLKSSCRQRCKPIQQNMFLSALDSCSRWGQYFAKDRMSAGSAGMAWARDDLGITSQVLLV